MSRLPARVSLLLAFALMGSVASAEPTPQKQDDDQAAAERHRHELEEPRPPPPEDVEQDEPPGWGRRLEVGGDFAFVLRPFNDALVDSAIGLEPAPAWGIHVRWSILSWLRFHAHFMDARHSLDLPTNALMADTSNSISAGSSIDTGRVQTFVFGGRLAPTYEFNARWRAWLSVGLGWGRFNYPNMTVTEPSGRMLEVRQRSGTFAEVPIGIGLSVDVIENWLAIEYEATGAPAFGQSGKAHEIFQAVDSEGNIRDVGPFGASQVTFVQTLGLSLIL